MFVQNIFIAVTSLFVTLKAVEILFENSLKDALKDMWKYNFA